MRVYPHNYGESILLAVSGGIDSLVMGELFCRDNGLDGAKVTLAVVHCNFHLRGEESDGDEAFVRDWAARHGLECFVAGFDTETFSREKGVSIEMAARELRYRYFDEICRSKGFCGVCVAHNANDNAETVVLNLLRGTGLRGICGMGEKGVNPYGSTPVFRPLLQWSRAEIEDFAVKHKLEFRTDSTNASSDYKRNRIRNEAFPVFEKINPSFIATFAENAKHFNEASDIVSDYCKGFGFDAGGRMPIASLKAFIHWKFVLYSVLSGYGFSSSVIEDVCGLLDSDRIISGKRFEGDGHLLVTTSSELILQPSSWCGGAKVAVREEEWDGSLSPKTLRGEILVDADVVGEPRFRKWEEGDWLRPIGMKGRKKVSDMLTDLKYDILSKEKVMVLEGEGRHVMAVLGERIDDSVRITSATRRVYRISIS